ncbi:tyrosine--tRNA ligase, partial [Candidatus Woesearchaeota archaeon]|nr:tyrosine--tRNA ligase [Candidatus Woesearchaeota archaeon]
KFKKAYCQEKEVKDNPILEYCKYIIFEKVKEFEIERPEKFGGNVVFKSYQELEDAFIAGQVHPADLKMSTAKYINHLLDPVREYFAKNPRAKKLKEQVESFQKQS